MTGLVPRSRPGPWGEALLDSFVTALVLVRIYSSRNFALVCSKQAHEGATGAPSRSEP